MNRRPVQDEARARRRLEQARARCVEPADRSPLPDVDELVRALLDVANIELRDEAVDDAAEKTREALRLAHDRAQPDPGDEHAATLLADAHALWASVLAELTRRAEEAEDDPDQGIPDSLPPDPGDADVAVRAAVAALQPALERAPESAEVLSRLAALHGQIAVSLDDGGEADEAFGHYRAALHFAERLHALDPADRSGRSALALAHNAFGHHYAETERMHDAEQHHEASRRLNQSLVDEHPGDQYLRYCLATDHENLCDLHHRAGDREAALQHAAACAALRERLAARADCPPEWRSQYADALRDVAELSMEAGKADEAIDNYREMLRVLRALAGSFSEHTDYLFRLADGYLVLGYALEDLGRLDAALQVYRDALDTDQRLVDRNPDDPRWHANTAHCHLCAALVLLQLGRDPEANEHVDEGLAILLDQLRAHPTDLPLLHDLSSFHEELATTFHRREELETAIAHYRKSQVADEKIVALEADDQQALANLAVTYDSLAALHERIGDLDEATRYGELAIRTEERLVKLDPESVEYQTRLVQALLNLAHTQVEQTGPDQALPALKRAESISARLARLVPADEKVRALGGQVDRVLGEARRESGDVDGAEEALLRSVHRLTGLVAEAVEPREWYALQAESLEALAELRLDMGRPHEALRDLEVAVARRAHLADRNPEATSAREFARTLDTWAEALEATGDLERAQDARARAAELLDRYGE